MEMGISIGVDNPNVQTVAENIQELVEGCPDVIGVHSNDGVITDLCVYPTSDFDYEIISHPLVADEIFTISFGKREITTSKIKSMDIYKNDDDRITQITLICGENNHIITLVDITDI